MLLVPWCREVLLLRGRRGRRCGCVLLLRLVLLVELMGPASIARRWRWLIFERARLCAGRGRQRRVMRCFWYRCCLRCLLLLMVVMMMVMRRIVEDLISDSLPPRSGSALQAAPQSALMACRRLAGYRGRGQWLLSLRMWDCLSCAARRVGLPDTLALLLLPFLCLSLFPAGCSSVISAMIAPADSSGNLMCLRRGGDWLGDLQGCCQHHQHHHHYHHHRWISLNCWVVHRMGCLVILALCWQLEVLMDFHHHQHRC